MRLVPYKAVTGYSDQENNDLDGQMLCHTCGSYTPVNSNFCTNCRAHIGGTPILETNQQDMQVKLQLANLKIQQEQLSIQKQHMQAQSAQYNSLAKCPRCGSTSLSGNTKGYGVVKGGLGALALGTVTGGVGTVIGLGAGNIGRKKVQCTCMQCGYKFKAGKR